MTSDILIQAPVAKASSGSEKGERHKVPGADCAHCPLWSNAFVPSLPAPSGTAKIVFVGEAPGRTEVRRQKPFVGPAGEILQRTIDALGITEYAVTNVALCYVPQDNEKESVTLSAAEHCRPRLLQELASWNPQVVVALGNIPLSVLTGDSSKGITKRRGHPEHLTLPNVGAITVVPTYHPAALLRRPDWFQDFSADLRQALRYVNGEVPCRVGTSPTVTYTYLTEDFAPALRAAEARPYAALDLETTGLDLHRDHLLYAVISVGDETFILDGKLATRPDFLSALASSPARWVGHNAKFDRNVLLAQHGVPVRFAFDTLLASYLLDERGGIHALEDVAARWLSAPNWKAEVDSLLKRKGIQGYNDLPKEVLLPYTAGDGYWTYRLVEALSPAVSADRGLKRVFQKLLMPGLHALSNAEVRGVRIDRQALEALVPICEARITAETIEAERLLGHPINLNSPMQVAKALFDELGLPQIEGRSTDAKKVLLHLQGKHPFVEVVLRFREQSKRLGTYVLGLLNALSPYDTVHTNFNLHGTTTGRLSSSSPNLQNITRDDVELRNSFVARDGMQFVYADYSQLELRCLAWLTDDPFLLEVYRQGRDLHGEMAEAIFGPNYTPAQRSLAKRLNFGLVYGRSVEAVAKDGLIELSREEARIIRERFFARMPEVVRWIEEVHQTVHRDHVVVSPLGRRRRFPFIPSEPSKLAEIYRQAVNMIPQSMASDATLMSFIKLDEAGWNPILTVHDSILIEVPNEAVEEALREQKRIMESTATELYGDKVPWVAEVGAGTRWGEIKV